MKHQQNQSDLQQIVKVLEDLVPDVVRNVSYSRQDVSKLSICLPANVRDMFPKVFDALEYRRRELGISTISVGMSMEDVFLRYEPT